MKAVLTYLFLGFFVLSVNSQNEKELSYDDFVGEVEKDINNDSSLYLKVDNNVFKNDKHIGHRTDYYYWRSDLVYKISVYESIRIKRSGYTIYFKDNNPIFYQIDRIWFSKKNKPKKVYFIALSNERIINYKTKNDLNKKKANHIFRIIKSDYVHWNNRIKDLRFDKI